MWLYFVRSITLLQSQLHWKDSIFSWKCAEAGSFSNTVHLSIHFKQCDNVYHIFKLKASPHGKTSTTMHQKDLLPFSLPCDKFKFITLEPNLWKYYDFKSIRLVTNVINSIWLSRYDLLWPLINQGCIFRLTCSYPELTKDHVLTSAYVNIFWTVTKNAVTKSAWRKWDCSWLPLNKHAMNIFI